MDAAAKQTKDQTRASTVEATITPPAVKLTGRIAHTIIILNQNSRIPPGEIGRDRKRRLENLHVPQTPPTQSTR